jgi:hypothetical protein
MVVKVFLKTGQVTIAMVKRCSAYVDITGHNDLPLLDLYKASNTFLE